MHILIIDDHEIVRDGIKTLIEQEYGWHVSYAVSSLDAIDIDVAILDIYKLNAVTWSTKYNVHFFNFFMILIWTPVLRDVVNKHFFHALPKKLSTTLLSQQSPY